MRNFRYESIKERLACEWRIYLAGLLIVLISDRIGRIDIAFGRGKFILFPIFYAILLGVLTGPHALKIMKPKQVFAAGSLVIVGIGPLITRIGIAAGSNINKLIEAGPALLLQEFGNLFTILLALPLAILLGIKRESIGAAHSINRETNLGLVSDLYGADSEITRGTLSVYILGGLIGTVFFGFLVSIVASLNIFHPYAMGMASGMGAFIMMVTGVATLGELYPQFAEQIQVYAGASEMLSGTTGLYMALFIGLPLTTRLYSFLEPKMRRFSLKESVKPDEIKQMKYEGGSDVRVREYFIPLIISLVAILLSNTLAHNGEFLSSLYGALLLVTVTFLGLVCKTYIPIKLPVVAYCALIGLILAGPWSPVAGVVVKQGLGINFLSSLGIVGAYAGISISNSLRAMLKTSWKMVIITLLVITGTFIGSTLISHIVLTLTNVI